MSIYIWKDIPSWIFWNQTDWIISIVWNNDILTISDKNLWATTAYNTWDTLSQNNCWNYYQRWNNYGFPWTWSVSTSYSQVNAGSYWPSNYYSNSRFICNNPRDSSSNGNLWWDTTNTNEARKWPCDTGWHIPSWTELTTLDNLLTELEIEKTALNFKNYLKFPLAWSRVWLNTSVWNAWEAVNQGVDWEYWSSTPHNWNLSFSITCFSSSYTIGSQSTKAAWFSIRPFKNEPVTPTSTRTVLYQPS